MWRLKETYIDGAFTQVRGREELEVRDPATEAVIGVATLADRADARLAIEAARRAQPRLGSSSKAERIAMLHRLAAAMSANAERICAATVEEYGAPSARAQWVGAYASQCFTSTAGELERYPLTRDIGDATVVMEPVGVAALFAPWNSAAGTICSKLASAIAAGCASVVKPSEFSPWQARVVAEAVHEADLPAGVCNFVVGRGADVGDELATHPGVAKISFTGSTPTGKLIARAGVETMKRVSLSLTGKSASIMLDDTDFEMAVPLALSAAFLNNGQACMAGTRLLVSRLRHEEMLERIRSAAADLKVGLPGDQETTIGPLASRAQFDRVQRFIAKGLEQGATLVVGGAGRPVGIDRGYFVKPTVFSDVHPEMDIAREEVFGPVLSVIAYDDEDDAIRLANDSPYGLFGYVFSSQPDRAWRIASQMEAGTVLVNRVQPELAAPFGGVKQSGIGREFGVFGIEAYLEPKTIVSRSQG